MHFDLEAVVDGIQSVRGVFVATLPDCLLYDSWTREGESWMAEEVAVHMGGLVRVHRAGLEALSASTSELQVTIESDDALVTVRELGNFAVAFVFDSDAPLGIVRLQLRQMIDVLAELASGPEAEEAESSDDSSSGFGSYPGAGM